MLSLSLKHKILLILLFFLSILALLFGLGYRYISHFSDESRAILEDNYESVRISALLQSSLHEIHRYHIQHLLSSDRGQMFKSDDRYQRGLLSMEAQLRAARQNITEPKEGEYIDQIARTYRQYLFAFRRAFNASSVQSQEVAALYPAFGETLRAAESLHQVNLMAIATKSKNVQESGYRVAFYLALLGMLGLIGGTALVFTLPGYLANPLLELNEKIQAVIAENYDHRLELRYHATDEVGELAASINKMATQLKNYERSRLAQLWHENQLGEAALDALPLGLLVLDVQYQVHQSNQKARVWLGMTAEEIKNTPSIMVLAAQNPALGRLWNSFGQEEEEAPAVEEEDKKIWLEEDDKSFWTRMEKLWLSGAESEAKLIGYLIYLQETPSE
ncbi:MAG: hypothetical protein OHK0053_22360 [Microscillaceae bacterium]